MEIADIDDLDQDLTSQTRKWKILWFHKNGSSCWGRTQFDSECQAQREGEEWLRNLTQYDVIRWNGSHTHKDSISHLIPMPIL